jgi:hypothetical protein
MAAINYDATTGPKQSEGGGAPMPKGDYVAVMVKSEVKETKNRDGKYVETEWTVVAPEKYNGRKFWHNINYENKSDIARDIGRGQLTFLCENAGIARLEETSTLHNKPVGVSLDIELGNDKPGGGKYPDKNRVTYFKKPGDCDFTAAPAAPTRTAPPAPWSGQQPPSSGAQAPTPAPAPAPAPSAPAPASGSTPPWARK